MITGVIAAIASVLFLTAIIIAAEFIAPVARYSLKSRIPGLVFGATGLAVAILAVAGLQQFWLLLSVQPLFTVPVHSLAGSAIALAAMIVLYDFLAYWFHRFQHRFLWPIHAVHHSPTELHVANGYAHFLERVVRWILISIPLTLIHFEFPPTPFVLLFLVGLLERYIHSSSSVHFGPLAKVLVDNRFHRIHHSLEPQHHDKNFGILFSFWDRLFGTAHEPRPGEWPATGVAGHPPPRSVAQYLLYPLRYSRPAALQPAARSSSMESRSLPG